MAPIHLTVNGKLRTVDVAPDTPLLWVIREHLGLTGTKFGCGMALCGACTVHLNGTAIRSCVTPISAAAGSMSWRNWRHSGHAAMRQASRSSWGMLFREL